MSGSGCDGIKGTVMLCPPKDTPYSDILRIAESVRRVTGCEGGRGMLVTVQGDILFFCVTEDEADRMESDLADVFGAERLSEDMCWCFDPQDDGEGEE